MSLSGSLDQAFSPWAKDVATEKLQLSFQLVDGLFLTVDSLFVRSTA